MAADTTVNQHLKQLMDGVPREAAASIGEAFLELAAQREGKAVADASTKLRTAWLELMKCLLRERFDMLNPQQQLFLMTGAVADSVTVKDSAGEKLCLQLLSNSLYEALLEEFTNQIVAPAWILNPTNRIHILASGQLKPFDSNRSGRYSGEALQVAGNQTAATGSADPQQLEQEYSRCRQLQQEVGQRTRRLVEVLASENLGPVMQGLMHPANELKRLSQDGQALASLSALDLGKAPKQHDSIARLRRLSEQFASASADLERSQIELLESMDSVAGLARRLQDGPAVAGSAAAPADVVVVLDEKARKLVESDWSSAASFVNQTLINDAKRSAWSSARVLLDEQLEKFSDPKRDCLLTVSALHASMEAMLRLHINCFPLDGNGQPVIPAVYIEPGVGMLKWMDDRYIASFVQTEPGRQGSELSLSGTDIAALRIMGLFLARGDIFNYRGERVSDSFMAEYAGHIEQKAVVKFTGASKKLSYGTSTEEKDGASREDAVVDYIDFIFAVSNGLPVPKKISPRKIGIILKYCVLKDVWYTSCLIMRLVAPSDMELARHTLLKLAHDHKVHAIELLRHAIESDPQVGSRYRNDAAHAAKEVFGKLADELIRQAESGLAPGEAGESDAVETVHDYFDV